MLIPAQAEELKLALWNAELARKGPGLLHRDIVRGDDPRVAAVLRTIADLDADILVLGGFDFDAGGLALAALNTKLPDPYPHLRPLRPNTGIPTGFDLDGDGRADGARDAQGFGSFPGQGGMAILSRLPVVPEESRDFSALLWRDLPGADLPPLPDGATDVLRLSTSGHHDTAVALPDGRRFHLLTWHGTTPAFDGPEDRNGRRNRDETRFWSGLIDGTLGIAPPPAPFAIIGQANADPDKGDGDPSAIRALLADPRLQDPLAGDTVDYGGEIGPLRVSYILPSADLRILDGAVEAAPEGARHRPIWILAEF